MFQSRPPSSPSLLYTGISELFWFNSDMLTDEHFEPQKCLATFHVVFVAGVCVYIEVLGKLSYCILNI